MPWPKGRKRTREDREKISKALAGKRAGENNPMWRGGKAIDSRGYILIRAPQHPDAMPNGYVKEHRLVMEGMLQRRLVPNEHVHHINGDKTDNSPANLELISNSAHTIHHHVGAQRSTRARANMSRARLALFDRKGRQMLTCATCGKEFYHRDKRKRYCHTPCRGKA